MRRRHNYNQIYSRFRHCKLLSSRASRASRNYCVYLNIRYTFVTSFLPGRAPNCVEIEFSAIGESDETAAAC